MGNACGFETRELFESFGSGALRTDGNSSVLVGGWFSAESARLGVGFGGSVVLFFVFVDLLAQHSSCPGLTVCRRNLKNASGHRKTGCHCFSLTNKVCEFL